MTLVDRTGGVRLRAERVIAEEPLAILVKGPDAAPELVTTTLRTPGEDTALAVGLVVTELAISPRDVVGVSLCPPPSAGEPAYRQATVVLRHPVAVPPQPSVRTSSCGWCGTDDLERRLHQVSASPHGEPIDVDDLLALHELVSEADGLFALTRAAHSAILARQGSPVAVGEDVGRHNALDKAIGHAALAGTLATGSDVILSGRIGTDLVLKAAAIGARSVIALGSPSHRAITTAEDAGIVLVGGLRAEGFRLYAHADRVRLHGAPVPTL
ncbi:formate dehydrogenase subunit FdhD [Acidimicrobium ferrooxidans DSM 10331]|uniref:Formate dehydrogenase subunit FdhD n=1 Tax=Acidimicrobium ferrooxidans (strain DSM 10331 / JCM 15462 / NBRC 103882 / ICP) TaxID=525909 RepID=C7LYH2_ACIFD|nr:FdhD/NarQ family protein [Acidimicrobium ferrooxidans]ACU53780.1 formate dehydrogenase subunit FdhD [Acidimicrobium ferrooxidans DSM 10331]